MRPLEELDHYELLEVARDARPDEIERAYGLVRAAYETDSLAAYSVFDPDEAASILGRIDEAWRVLSDPDRRRAYDAATAGGDGAAALEPEPEPTFGLAQQLVFAPLDAPAPPTAISAFDAEPEPEDAREEEPEAETPAGSWASAAPDVVEEGEADDDIALLPPPLAAPPRPVAPPPREFAAFDDVDEGHDAPWDGARLRRARLVRGIDVEAVVAATKINPTYLRFLEEDRFDDLPALVYVRGFVAAYARHLGLDAALVSRSYSARCEEHRSARPRSRGLGRR